MHEEGDYSVCTLQPIRSDLEEDVFYDLCKTSHYLLVSPSKAITTWHTDMSYTSVFYFLPKGAKAFYLVRPTMKNMVLWDGLLAQDRRDLWFGSHPDLDYGGCQRVVVSEGQAVVMPAGMIHAVETIGTSVAFGE